MEEVLTQLLTEERRGLLKSHLNTRVGYLHQMRIFKLFQHILNLDCDWKVPLGKIHSQYNVAAKGRENQPTNRPTELFWSQLQRQSSAAE